MAVAPQIQATILDMGPLHPPAEEQEPIFRNAIAPSHVKTGVVTDIYITIEIEGGNWGNT